MLSHLRNSGLIVIGTSMSILMIGLAALIALPILAAVALALVLAGPSSRRLDRMRAAAMGGPVIEGQWTMLDLRAPAEGRTKA
ncbi:hypothetical protein [Tabrizicola sp. YIM 78059]|uniref:hypothetical protein n=1 Tax=Tabrizicola sp. YIM 78059 TaxID=2529861 RepID=UPI0010AA3FCC|nr:hypothetical protein [Tabrizicola sp. YIM 78059]